MPTGSKRRGESRTFDEQLERDRRAARESAPPKVVEPKRRNVRLEAALAMYPFKSFVGMISDRNLSPTRMQKGGHPTSPSARRLLADGRLVVTSEVLTEEGVTREFWFVTGPTDLQQKLDAFGASLLRMLITGDPDGADFPGAFDPAKYPGWSLYEDAWFALSDGVIFTFDQQVAYRIREAYIDLCEQFLPDLYAKASHCRVCRSSNLFFTDEQVTCRECGLTEAL